MESIWKANSVKSNVTHYHSMKNSGKQNIKQTSEKRGFSREERLQAVMLYRETGNISQTAVRVGVSRVALRAWIKEFNDVATIDPRVSAACIRAIESASEIRQEFLLKHYAGLTRLIEKAINRLEVLIDKSESIPAVNSALENAANIIRDFTPTEDKPTGVQVNLLQQTIKKE